MKILYDKASELYHYNIKEIPFPGDKELPSKIIFEPEDLRQDYIFTPMDELFTFAVNRLMLTFEGATFKLQRSGGFPPLMGAPDLLFKAYKEGQLSSVEYNRRIYPRWKIEFDGLDNGEANLEDIIRYVKTSKPLGGIVNINLDGLFLSLENFSEQPSIIDSFYELTVDVKPPNIPWLTEIMPAKFNKKFKGNSYDEAVETTEVILIGYLSQTQKLTAPMKKLKL